MSSQTRVIHRYLISQSQQNSPLNFVGIGWRFFREIMYRKKKSENASLKAQIQAQVCRRYAYCQLANENILL